MKKKFNAFAVILLSATFFLSGSCFDMSITGDPDSTKKSDTATDSESDVTSGATVWDEDSDPVRVISAEEARTMMNTLDSYIIVDVREQSEYDAGHIEGAVLVPVGSIGELAPIRLPDKDEVLLLYCRSGNRSARAAEQLSKMGYTNIYDFGGIRDWPYETVAAE